jgi:ligand-binding SRPBCC domain-containing protein
MTYQFETASFLPDVSVQDVWAQIGDFGAVNAELSPIFRMTFPARYYRISDIPADGESHFTSTILLFGVLPVDRHRVAFLPWDAPYGFDERSSNFNMKIWTHRRMLTEALGGVIVTDVCSLEPRIPLLGGVLRALFAAVFRHRHRHLRQVFSGRAA